MKVGLLGGTFDPLHNGHFAMASAARSNGGIDRLIIMPSGRPPHKTGEFVLPAAYRYEMAVLAFGEQPDIEVSSLEIARPGRSFTIDTIQQLKAELHPDDELVLVYGSDILNDIEHWHQPAAIMAACPLLLASRGGIDHQNSLSKAQELTSRYGARISFFAAPEIELSSSKIRAAIQANQDWQQFVPEKIVRFINRHQLYRHQDELAALPSELWQQLAELERQLRPMIDKKRLIHSLNVMLYALHLAVIHGIDTRQTGIAGLLHDCAKSLPKKEVIEYALLAGDPSLAVDELAHGPAGAWLVREKFGIHDPVILHAINFHTTGCGGMTQLDKIIFIADKVEPARTYENLNEIRRLVEFDIDAALQICIGEISCFLEREQLPPHPYTQHASDELEQRQNGKI